MRALVAGGLARCTLALGFGKMEVSNYESTSGWRSGQVHTSTGVWEDGSEILRVVIVRLYILLDNVEMCHFF